MIEKFDWEQLIAWFTRERRDLPWRTNPTPYAVWISEIMLQQTQVAVVIPYFERWMSRFPTIQILAEASLQEVLKLWEGLGYYSRARNIHDAARYILLQHHGHIPSTREDLGKIKGLGPYTIGALLSFAFHQKAAAVDGNVIRVLARYFMLEGDVSKGSTQKGMRELAERILPNDGHWLANEGLIELGATICSRKPKCEVCPLRRTCKSFLAGVPHIYPKKSAKGKITNLYRSVSVICSNDLYLVRKGKQGSVMADLYEFPYFESSAIGAVGFSQLISEKLDLSVRFVAELTKVSHSFTRYRAHLTPFLFWSPTLKQVRGYDWFSKSEMEKIPFSSGHRRILEQVQALETLEAHDTGWSGLHDGHDHDPRTKVKLS